MKLLYNNYIITYNSFIDYLYVFLLYSRFQLVPLRYILNSMQKIQMYWKHQLLLAHLSLVQRKLVKRIL